MQLITNLGNNFCVYSKGIKKQVNISINRCKKGLEKMLKDNVVFRLPLMRLSLITYDSYDYAQILCFSSHQN